MISIIISSYQPQFYLQLKNNIAASCGIPYEIIKIDNPGIMSITKAYNIGAEQSQYDNLLFLHEDVLFHTQNWGEKLIAHLSKNKTGVIGVAGSNYVPSAPCSWTVVSKINRNFIKLYQSNKDGSSQKLHSNINEPVNVFALDGVFMAISKAHYINVRFNEEVFGFHGYDQDFSLRSAMKYKNYVIDDILIEHFSSGDANKDWFFSNIQVRKNINYSFQDKNISQVEREAYIDFINHFFNYHKPTIGNAINALYFYPFFKLTIKDHYRIFSLLFYYLYRKPKNT
ncbi:glycosyltransferase [Chryseobacterium sp. JAH]|uniref:glycosyltransferase n=1 Tax=Chryseobacterium sp. JAH TaxID=1742858 RepID=UPI0007412364|nr:glycosyltransferase [Chryseobacterium sp. JAH]KUJ51514.1 hypothetical protein AR685_07625 [Chryseobacterium sp. JAH]